MLSRKETSVVTTVLFVGIILSCTIFFGVTSMLDLGGTDSFSFDLEEFDDDFYKNEDLAEVVTFCDYKLFGRVKNKNILVGYDNFLFEIEKNGYNFIEDYVGNAGFTQNELDMILKNLTLRKEVYADMGIEYMIAVIPNSQTVYSENVPFYLGELSKNTRLEQLERYLDENSEIYLLDPTGMFTRIKNNYPVYNNTENTINSLGAYYLYKEIFRALPSSYTNGSKLIEDYIDSLTLHYTDGRELARLAEVDSIVKNRTLSIQTEIPYMYESSIEYENIETTHIKDEYKEEFSVSSSVMIEYANEWDKLLLTPYFSNTFQTVVYKKNYNYNSRVIKDNSVTAVIQVVRENELDTFLDSNITLSYNAGVAETEAEDMTSTPLMLAKIDVNADTVCVAGRATENSILTIQGAGMKNKTMTLYGEQFIIGLLLKEGIKERVNILAASGGKEVSEPLEVDVTANPSAKPTGIVIGENSRLTERELLDKYIRNKLYSMYELLEIRTKHENEVQYVQNKTNKETEFIYLVAPSKINVYSSDFVGYQKPLVSKLDQFVRSIEGCKNTTVIDLTDTMYNNRHLGQLYYQTAPEWTELGAYLGYLRLAEHIKKSYPAVKVNEFEDYLIERVYTDGGRYAVALGLDPVAFSELVPVLSASFSTRADLFTYEQNGFFSYQSTIDDDSLPTAVVICDTYGEEITEFIAEHFSSLRVLSVFEKEVSDFILSEVNPDYVIKIFGEDNLDYFVN